jgi:hypothetical protein
LLGVFFGPEDGGDMFLRNGLHGVTSQKIILFRKYFISVESGNF